MSGSVIAVEAAAIEKSFGAAKVLRSVSLKVRRGEVLALIGPSGSGKSTFLRCLNLLETPDGGRLRIFDQVVEYSAASKPKPSNVAALRAHTGMVFQHFDLFPHLTVLGNVIEAPMTVLKVPKARAVEDAMRLLESVGLAAKAGAFPDRLSGGQKQRVAIARALAMAPDVMCLRTPGSGRALESAVARRRRLGGSLPG